MELTTGGPEWVRGVMGEEDLGSIEIPTRDTSLRPVLWPSQELTDPQLSKECLSV